MWENRYKGVYYSFSGCKQIEGGAFSNEWKIVKKFGTFEILYFKRKQWYPFATNDWEIYLYLGRLSSEVAGELLDLKEKKCTQKSLKKTFKNYPNIYRVFFDKNPQDYRVYPESYQGEDAAGRICRGIKLKIVKSTNELSKSDENTLTNTLVYTALDLEKEFDEIRHKGYPAEYLEFNKTQSTVSSGLEKAVLITGILGLKFAAKAIGAEIDIPIPTDGNGPDIDIDVNTDVDADFDTGDTPDAYADVDNQHNVSFGKSVSQLETEISNYKKDIRAAEKEINYWEYQDSIHSNPSDHYRKSIDIGLKNAGKKYDEATKKLEELMNELQKLKK